MRNGILATLGVLLGGAGLASAQSVPYGYLTANAVNYGPPPAVLAAQQQQYYQAPLYYNPAYYNPAYYNPAYYAPQYYGVQQPTAPAPATARPAVQPVSYPGAGASETPVAADAVPPGTAMPPWAAPVVSVPQGAPMGIMPTGACGPHGCPGPGCCPPPCCEAPCPPPCCEAPCCPEPCCKKEKCGKCFFIEADYLYWWIRDPRLPAPVAATADPATLLVTGTPIGPQDLDLDPFSGLRVSAGGWLDSGHRVGLEASGFFLGQRSTERAARAAFTDGVILFAPLSVPPTPLVTTTFPGIVGVGALGGAEPAAFPALLSGGITLNANSTLWGADASVVLNLARSDSFEGNLLLGGRYLGLEDELNIHQDTVDVATGITIGWSDRFFTRNTFYGGQIGIRGDYRVGRWSMSLSGKAALGTVRQTVSIQGGSQLNGTAQLQPSNNIGIFARDTAVTINGVTLLPNAGTRSRNVFAVVPEGRAEIGYDIGRYTTLTAGYTFLYLSNVVRAPDQILTGIAASLPVSPTDFIKTDFWAQGLDLGLAFSF